MSLTQTLACPILHPWKAQLEDRFRTSASLTSSRATSIWQRKRSLRLLRPKSGEQSTTPLFTTTTLSAYSPKPVPPLLLLLSAKGFGITLFFMITFFALIAQSSLLIYEQIDFISKAFPLSAPTHGSKFFRTSELIICVTWEELRVKSNQLYRC